MRSKFINVRPINTTYKLLVVLSFVLVVLSVLPGIVQAAEASFYFSPSKGNYKVGENFFVDVLINVEGISINAAQASIYFPPEKLRVLEISKKNSVFSLWVEEPVFSNSQGEMSFLGGLPSPGFIGKAGKVIKILFKAKSPGEAKISFSGEKILANDPYGTNIFSSSRGETYSIVVPEEYVPPEEPERPPPTEADTQLPHPFEIILDNEGDPTNPAPLLYFETKDDISGISHYEVKIKEDVFKVKKGENYPWRTPNLPPGTHHISVKAIDRAGNFIESSIEVKIESIPVPEITICPGVFRSGEEVLFVSGTAIPESKVIVFFEKNEKLIKKWEISSDKEGNWSLAKEGLFRSEIYKISAKVEDSRGAISNSSEPCFVKVILGGIAIGPLIISYKNLTLITIILFFILLAFILYLVWRIRRTQKLIERETKDLKTKFYKEYNELRTDIERQLTSVRKTRDIRPFTDKEKEREDELLKDLADVERVIREELKDIEEIT